jgi:hypothetical protein
VDVKMTEADLPWFMRLSVVPAINAHARVSILQKNGGAGGLPVGVPDSNPVGAAAIFVNEANGSVIGTQTLPTGQTMTLNGETLTEWTGDPVSVNITSTSTGVVVALSGKPGWTPAGTLSEICNQTLVQCYQGEDIGPWTGLSYIHGYQSTGIGTPVAPIVRDVQLYNQTCTDDSAPYFLLHAGCQVGVKAKIDFGLVVGGDPSLPVAQGGLLAQLKVEGWSCPSSGPNPKGCNMHYNTAGLNAGYWTTDGSNGYPVMPADGVANRLDLNWKTAASGASTFTSVQRSFSASPTTSGPVDYVTVSDNSLSLGSHTVSVAVGVKGSLQANATSVNDPVVALKVTGSRNQKLDCDPAVANIREEIGYGCAPLYEKNTGTACPATNGALWALPQPWNCVGIDTGNSAGQINQGMLIRTQEGSNSCVHQNNWSLFPNIPAGDPRIVPVFLVPFGSFNGSGGNTTVPVRGFATFYVTGWSQGNGGSNGDPCPNADPVPGGGYIVGHFIKYVESINTGGGGAPCDFGSLGTCVAVLTD